MSSFKGAAAQYWDSGDFYGKFLSVDFECRAIRRSLCSYCHGTVDDTWNCQSDQPCPWRFDDIRELFKFCLYALDWGQPVLDLFLSYSSHVLYRLFFTKFSSK